MDLETKGASIGAKAEGFVAKIKRRWPWVAIGAGIVVAALIVLR